MSGPSLDLDPDPMEEERVENENLSIVSSYVAGPSTQAIPGRPSSKHVGKEKAPIWKHFKICEQKIGQAICNYCAQSLSYKTGSTTSMHRHLINRHKKQAELFLKDQEQKKITTENLSKFKQPEKTKQSTLFQVIENKTAWPSSHPKAERLTKKIGIWMAKSLHPYSLVEEHGFIDVMAEAVPLYRLPSRNTFSRKIIPCLFEEKISSILSEIQSDLDKVKSIAFTSDLWTSGSNDSYISLTLHYTSPDFHLKKFCLGNELLEGIHDFSHISEKLKSMTTEWSLHNVTIPIYGISDNAKNISNAMKHLEWNHIPCFAHTLQLALGDAKKNTAGMSVMLAKARAIVGHYKRSPTAQQRLHEYQKGLGKPEVQLIQDCETRWNSEFNMLTRLIQQKEAISGELVSSSTKVDNLSTTQWMLAEEYIDILKPLDEATTRSSGSEYSTISMVYPLILTTENILSERIKQKKPGITFCRQLLQTIQSRFVYLKTDIFYKICTALDPHFKCALLKQHERDLMVEKLTTEAMSIITTGKLKENLQNPITDPHQQSTSKTDFWTTFEQIASEGQETTQPVYVTDKAQFISQLEIYFGENRLPPKEDALQWWRDNNMRFPFIAPLAKKYLSIPATEVESERVFSSAGNVVTDRRRSLTSEHVNQLVFLHQNF